MIDMRNCVFGFKCSANWDDMKPADEQSVRHCSHCGENVYFVSTPDELNKAIELNRCVAIAPHQNNENEKLARPMLGVPSKDQNRSRDSSLDDHDDPFFFVGKMIEQNEN
jgi:hypothetical protein